MYKEQSSYPEKVDDLIFYSDVSISKRPIMNQHTALIKDGRYTEASQYIHDNDIHGHFAGLYNLMGNRLAALQERVRTLTKYNPHYFTGYEPDANVGEMWIEVEQGSYEIMAKYPHSALANYSHDELSKLS